MNDDQLPREWCRGPQFAGEAERKEWAPVLKNAQEAWVTAELVSVSAGLRPSALVYLTPEELPVAVRDTANAGLQVTPLQLANGSYRVAVHQPGYARPWLAAWAAGDDELIGQLLGFPACCRAKFAEVWVERRSRDQAPYTNAFAGPWETNVLLRHLGVRLVPHLPCSGDCAETLRLARAYLEAGLAAGADVEAIERLLRLPLTYDALNGVAIVDAGSFRFMHGTDYSPKRQMFKRESQPGAPEVAGPPSWADNGFSSLSAMDAAHAVVLAVATRAQSWGPVESWLDLGAGDGTLLARIGGTRRVAVEVDSGRADRGLRRHPEVMFFDKTIAAFLSELGPIEPFGAALLMPGRVLELPEGERAAMLADLKRVAKRVLCYAYGDWLGRHGGLVGLAAAAGLRLLGPAEGDDQARAAWAEVI